MDLLNRGVGDTNRLLLNSSESYSSRVTHVNLTNHLLLNRGVGDKKYKEISPAGDEAYF